MACPEMLDPYCTLSQVDGKSKGKKIDKILVEMGPYGFILRESEATWVIKVLILVKGVWYEILY